MADDGGEIRFEATLNDLISDELESIGSTIEDVTRGLGAEVGPTPSEGMAGLESLERMAAEYEATMGSLQEHASALAGGGPGAMEVGPEFEALAGIAQEQVTRYGGEETTYRDIATGQYVATERAAEAFGDALIGAAEQLGEGLREQVAEAVSAWGMVLRGREHELFGPIVRVQERFAALQEMAAGGMPEQVQLRGMWGRTPGAEAMEYVGGRVEALGRFTAGQEVITPGARVEIRETVGYMDRLDRAMTQFAEGAETGVAAGQAFDLNWQQALETIIPGLNLTHVSLAAIAVMAVTAGRHSASAFEAAVEPLRVLNRELHATAQAAAGLITEAVPGGAGELVAAVVGAGLTATESVIDLALGTGERIGSVIAFGMGAGLTVGFAVLGFAIGSAFAVGGPIGAAVGAGAGLLITIIVDTLAESVFGVVGDLFALGGRLAQALLEGLGQGLAAMQQIISARTEWAEAISGLAERMQAPVEWAQQWQTLGAILGDQTWAREAFGGLSGQLEYLQHRFAAVGVNIYDHERQLLSVGEILRGVREQYQATATPMERVIQLQMLFGAGWETVEPLMALPAGEFERVMGYMNIMDELAGQSDRWVVVGMGLRAMEMRFMALAYTVADAALPMIEDALNVLERFLTERTEGMGSALDRFGHWFYVEGPTYLGAFIEAGIRLVTFLQYQLGPSLQGIALILVGMAAGAVGNIPVALTAIATGVSGLLEARREGADVLEQRLTAFREEWTSFWGDEAAREIQYGEMTADVRVHRETETRFRIDCPFEAACPFKRDFTSSVARAVATEQYQAVAIG